MEMRRVQVIHQFSNSSIFFRALLIDFTSIPLVTQSCERDLEIVTIGLRRLSLHGAQFGWETLGIN